MRRNFGNVAGSGSTLFVGQLAAIFYHVDVRMVSTQRKPVSQITDKDVKMTRRPDLNPHSIFFNISSATPKAIPKPHTLL